MLGYIDKSLDVPKSRLFLCKPNRETIAELTEASKKEISYNSNGIHELSFRIPYVIEKDHKFIKNDHVDLLRGHFLIRYEKGNETHWFIINKPKNVSQDGVKYKESKCYLLPFQLNRKIVRNYSVTKKLYDDVGSDGILNETLLRKTDWSVGYIDADIALKYRTFDISEKSLLEFIISDIVEAFDCIVLWDTVNKQVNFYKEENLGTNKGLSIENGKYLKSINEEPDFDNVITRLYAFGKDGLPIQSLNPSGSEYIEDLSYYMYPFERDVSKNVLSHSNYMSDSLCHAILDYNDLLSTKEGEFNTLLSNKETNQTDLSTKENELFNLQTDLEIIQDSIDIANGTNSQYDNTVAYSVGEYVIYNSSPYKCIQDTTAGILPTDTLYWENLITSKSNKQTEITIKNEEINSIEISTTVDTGATASGNITLTVDGHDVVVSVSASDTPSVVAQKISDAFNISYTNATYRSTYSANVVTTYYSSTKAVEDITINFSDTGVTGVTVSQSKVNYGTKNKIATIDNDITTIRNEIAIENNFTADQIVERDYYIHEKTWMNNHYDNENDLYNQAKVELGKVKQPLVYYSIDIVDFLKVVDCQRDWDKLKQFDIVTIKYPEFNVSIKAKIISIKHNEDSNSISLEIANSKDIDSGFLSMKDILNQAVSSSTTLDMSKFKWDKSTANENEINKIVNNKWDATKNAIEAGVNESVDISKRGIIIKDPNDPLKFLVAQHGVLAITNDGGNTWKHAMTPEGIVGERIFGKLGVFAQVLANQITLGDGGEKIQDTVIESADSWNAAESNANTYTDTQITEVNTTTTNLQNQIDDFSSDGKLTLSEANALETSLNQVESESTDVISIANSLGITTEKDSYNNALFDTTLDVNGNAIGLKPYLTDNFINQISYPIDITSTQRTEISNRFSNVQDTKSILINKISSVREQNAKDSSVPKGEKFDNSVLVGNGHGIKILDDLENLRVHLGQYEAGKYGLLVKNKAGTSTILDEDGILQTDTIQEADNVDSTNPLKLKFYIDEDTIRIDKIKLNFSLEAFRAYSTGASSGGSSSVTSSSGGGTTTESTDPVYVFMSGATGDSTYSENLGSPSLSIDSNGSHDHGGAAGSHNHGNTNNSNYAPPINSDGYHGHSGSVSLGYHAHATYNHGHTVTVTIPDHSHGVSIPSHTHGIIYGIYTSTTATGINVKVNGITVDSSGYTTDKSDIDLTQHITTTGWHTIELTSSRLGRINASLYMKTFIGT